MIPWAWPSSATRPPNCSYGGARERTVDPTLGSTNSSSSSSCHLPFAGVPRQNT